LQFEWQMIEYAIERFFNGKMSFDCILCVKSIVACLNTCWDFPIKQMLPHLPYGECL
jgi:hypothetical protein